MVIMAGRSTRSLALKLASTVAKGDISKYGGVDHPDGKQRLLLFYEQVSDRQLFDFHSLVWERKTGSDWAHHRTITRENFDAGSPLRRWISKVHGFGELPGHAIIQVGQAPAPPGGAVEYSWRDYQDDQVHDRD